MLHKILASKDTNLLLIQYIHTLTFGIEYLLQSLASSSSQNIYGIYAHMFLYLL